MAALLPVLIYSLIRDHVAIMLCSVTALLALPGIHTVFSTTEGPRLNATLGFTGKILLLYSVLFAIGWVL
ncbi:MAG: 1,4-dihydroxy-2-naphthoate polyprenyltransferase, partial [Candidatus Omnitrophica bacterium]|nr:1,4-dihydroxy-2-naphthoate polyprenyltransferase [Candidatus Omnitrophota bacterium]